MTGREPPLAPAPATEGVPPSPGRHEGAYPAGGCVELQPSVPRRASEPGHGATPPPHHSRCPVSPVLQVGPAAPRHPPGAGEPLTNAHCALGDSTVRVTAANLLLGHRCAAVSPPRSHASTLRRPATQVRGSGMQRTHPPSNATVLPPAAFHPWPDGPPTCSR